MQPLAISATSLATCLGRGRAAHLHALRHQASGLAPCRFETVVLDTWIGEVAGVDDVPIAGTLSRFDCRNNRLALLGLETDGFVDAVARARARNGAARIGVFLGTSTSGILQTELAYRRRAADGSLPPDFHYAETNNTFSLADFARRVLALEGPAVVVSAACASSAKVFASAARAMAAGLCDAAVVGGVDSLALTTLYGFASLGLLSAQPCRPWDAARDGISIAEGAAFALLERPGQASSGASPVQLVGTGESSDAHHMSSPHPEGAGARLALERALRSAGMAPGEVDYVNLHGTATRSNDAAEALAVAAVLGERVPASSSKGLTGHALGAAGGIEALLTVLALEEGLLPAGGNTSTPDPALGTAYVTATRPAPLRRALSNSFGFGGANCALAFRRAA